MAGLRTGVRQRLARVDAPSAGAPVNRVPAVLAKPSAARFALLVQCQRQTVAVRSSRRRQNPAAQVQLELYPTLATLPLDHRCFIATPKTSMSTRT